MAERALCALPGGSVATGFAPPGTGTSVADLHHLFPAGSDAVRRTLAAVTGWLGHLPAPPADPAMVELVLAEALNNVVEHACGALPGRVIGLELWVVRAGLTCRVTDDGRPMPGGRLPRRHMPTAEKLPEGGFGWPLIAALTRDLSYRRNAGHNILTFRIAPDCGA